MNNYKIPMSEIRDILNYLSTTTYFLIDILQKGTPIKVAEISRIIVSYDDACYRSELILNQYLNPHTKEISSSE